jgi:uncharacterized damage-inducible protein DinB
MTKDVGPAIADQIRRCLEGEAWHGPSVLEALAGVSATEAAARPLQNAHSIWEIVLHLAATHRLVISRARGNPSRLSPEQDWPLVAEASPAAWTAAVEQLRATNAELCRVVQQFSEDRLYQPLVDDVTETAFGQFVGIAEHDVYHAGQIALLRRALSAASDRAK